MGRYTLKELADAAGESERTVRYYQSLGLLRQPGQIGPGSHYEETDLLRLRLVRELKDRMTLREIAAHLRTLDESGLREEALRHGSALDYVRSVLGDAAMPTAPVVSSSRSAPPTPPSDTTTWERIEVVPGIELHVRHPITAARRRAIAAYIALARKEMEGDT
jgi:DNA-binding transcriptional MerR regulator